MKLEDDLCPTTVAELEEYGLDLRTINTLERELGCIYLDQLQVVTEAQVLAIPMVGPAMVACLRAALRNYLAGNMITLVVEVEPEASPRLARSSV